MIGAPRHRDGTPGSRPLAASDALFLHISTPTVPQQMGAVIIFDTNPRAPVPGERDVAALLSAIPGITGRLEQGSAWRRPRLRTSEVDPVSLVERVDLAGTDASCSFAATVDAFFSEPLDVTRSVAHALLVTGPGSGECALLLKLHHALGDGVGIYRTLLAHLRGRRVPAGRRHRGVVRMRRVPQLVRGLWAFATKGAAPASPLDGPIDTTRREHRLHAVPTKELGQVAAALDASREEVLLALFLHALSTALRRARRQSSGCVRVLLPRSVRGTATLAAGDNRTGAVSVDLSLEPLAVVDRLHSVRVALRRQLASGAVGAGSFVVRGLGVLPPWLHARAARTIYSSRWFNVIATVLPGPRQPLRMAGRRIETAYPLLPLAAGTGLAWGAMTWADRVTLGVTTTPANAEVLRGLRTAFDEALRAFHAVASDDE